MLKILTKNYCNNIYLQLKPFKITLKPNSYLTSIFRSDAENPLIPTFPNIILKKKKTNLPVVCKITEKGCNNLYLLTNVFHRTSKPNSDIMPISHCGLINPSTPAFPNINLTKTIKKLLLVSKITKKELQQFMFPP